MPFTLRPPELKDEDAFQRACEATRITDPNFAKWYEAGMDYRDWLAVLEERRAGIGLEAGHGPAFFLLGWVGDAVVGRLTFRPAIEEPLLSVRGNIGYVVVPQYRRRGYASEMLRSSFPIARQAGLKRVTITCDEGNLGSQKTIERCGGVFECLSQIPGDPVRKMVYRIDLP